MKKYLIFILLTFFAITLNANPKYLIKFAALAPKGSTWMNILEDLDKTLREKSNGELGFNIYPGGVAGDENKVLRKIRIGQLHAGGFTGVGLGQIVPEERILDSPFLFHSSEEVDLITADLFERFTKKFDEKGFVLLGWAEVGFVYMYTKDKIERYDQIKDVKMWVWESDPIAKAAFSSLDLNPIPLSITDVITSLQSGIVDAVYISPLAAISLQWYTRINYMFDIPIANAMGAVVIDKREFNKLPEKYQTLLVEEAKKYLGEITEASRRDNIKSIEVMKKNGVQIIRPFSSGDVEKFEEAGKRARQGLVGELYDQELLDKVEGELKAFRKKNK